MPELPAALLGSHETANKMQAARMGRRQPTGNYVGSGVRESSAQQGQPQEEEARLPANTERGRIAEM